MNRLPAHLPLIVAFWKTCEKFINKQGEKNNSLRKNNRLLSPKNEQKKLTVKVNCNSQLHPNKI
jgi:hypothetical protein